MKLRTLLMALVLFALFMVVPSCVTAGDIRSLADTQELFQSRTDEALEKLAAGQSDAEEAREEISGAAEDAKVAVEKVIQDVADRTEKGAKGLIDGLTDPAGAAQAGIAMLALQWYRQRQRKKLGEPVA